MKIFISWSGELSKKVAIALKEWISYVFPSTVPFVSSEDIRKGQRWVLEISQELDESNFGIICLTSENLNSPWILFEAGALSKSLKGSNVCTLLIGVAPEDVSGPLSTFQHTSLNKIDFHKLVLTINSHMSSSNIKELQINHIFDTWWPQINSTIENTLKTYSQSSPTKRSDREILIEILELNRYSARYIKPTPNNNSLEETFKLKKLFNLSIDRLNFSPKTLKS